LDAFAKVASDLNKMGVPQVAIAGGEALLRKDLNAIIKIFADQKIFPQLTTNGSILTEKRLAELVDAGLKRITFSFDGHTPELYQKIRGVDWFEKNVTCFKQARSTYGDRLMLDSNTVISSLNVNYIEDIVNFLVELGSESISFAPVVVEASNNLLETTRDELFPTDKEAINKAMTTLLRLKNSVPTLAVSKPFIHGMHSFLLSGGKPGFSCYAGYLSADIYSDGDVRLCGSTEAVGNIGEQSFARIWQSNRALQSRQKMSRGQCPGCYISCKLEPSLVVNPANAMRTFWEKKVKS
jgi:pyrroloquinoline quinone biosynthesis protein E